MMIVRLRDILVLVSCRIEIYITDDFYKDLILVYSGLPWNRLKPEQRHVFDDYLDNEVLCIHNFYEPGLISIRIGRKIEKGGDYGGDR